MAAGTYRTICLITMLAIGAPLCRSAFAAQERSPQTPPNAAAALPMVVAGRPPPIGKPLPVSTTALDANGKTVTLRSVMHGPAVVIKVVGGCPPCQAMLDFVRRHGAAYARTHQVQLVVLYAAAPPDPTAARFPTDLPSSVVALHTSANFTTGFLPTELVPAVFFFDKNLTLVARRNEMSGSAADMLAWPKSAHGR